MNTVEIANEINKQLNWLGLPVRWSWGIHAEQALPAINGFRGGLQAKVNGAKFKGHLRIWLTGSDDYTIQLGSLRAGVFTVKKTMEGVYCDQLAELIDSTIET